MKTPAMKYNWSLFLHIRFSSELYTGLKRVMQEKKNSGKEFG